MKQKVSTYFYKRLSGYLPLSICLFFIVPLSSVSLRAQVLSTELSETHIVVGDQIDWKWTLTIPREDALLLPPQFSDSIDRLLVIKKSSVDSVVTDTGKMYTQHITVAGFDSFQVIFPKLRALVYSATTNDTIEVKSQNIHDLLVSTVDVDTTRDFMPIKEIVVIDNPEFLGKIKEHISENRVLYIIAGIIILLLIIALILRRAFKNRKGKSALELPYQKAFRKMHELENAHLWENEEYKKYYTELSVIIKDYIREEKGIDTNQLTSTELLKEIKKNRKLKKVHRPLRELLYTADLTKFAKGMPHEEYRQEAIQNAEMIINTIEQEKITDVPYAQ